MLIINYIQATEFFDKLDIKFTKPPRFSKLIEAEIPLKHNLGLSFRAPIRVRISKCSIFRSGILKIGSEVYIPIATRNFYKNT